MAARRQGDDGCVVDDTINVKAKFTRLRYKSLRRNISPRFNTVSFSLVHSREKLWNIAIFFPGIKKEEGEREKACVSASL